MKSLIIGGSGFVGGYLARHLRALGHQTAVTKMPGEQAGIFGTDTCGITVFDLDILAQDAVSKLIHDINPDYIFHLAAQSSVAASWENPGLTADVNIKGSIRALSETQ